MDSLFQPPFAPADSATAAGGSPWAAKRPADEVAPLLRHLGLGGQAVQVLPYHPPEGFVPRALNCHLNVWGQVRQAGGRPMHGWVIYDESTAGGGAEAIFHTVWRGPDGGLYDVTPRADGAAWVRFVADPRRRIVLAEHEGRPAIRTYANVRVQGGRLLAPLRRLEIVLDPGFAEALGLWPW